MANSKVGQYRIEFEVTGYTAPVRSHVFGMWIAPTIAPATGAPPATINIQLKSGDTAPLTTVANDILNFIRPLYTGTLGIGAYTLWRYVTNNARDFVTAGIATTAVNGAGSVQIAQQATLTFRHANGGIGKVVLIECNQAGDTQTNLIPSATGSSLQRLAAYLLSTQSPMIALDNSFPVAPLKASLGQNESVWRKIYRQ